MRETSALYKRLISSRNHYFEYAVVIGEDGRLITRQGERIVFGGFCILIDRGGADSGYTKSALVSLQTKQAVFKNNEPSLGNAIAGEITVKMITPSANIPRMAQIVPYVRVCVGEEKSEWLQMGLYYIDTREQTNNGDGLSILSLHGYDTMLKAEQDYPSVTHDMPCDDITAVHDIAAAINCNIDPRTIEMMTERYQIEIPAGYTCRDTLGYIASLYGGSFIFNDDGLLQLIRFGSIPKETRYLIDNVGFIITFGGDRILV